MRAPWRFVWCTAHTEQEFDAESKLLALQSLHADPTADINQKLTQFNAVRHSLVTVSPTQPRASA